MKIVVDCRYTRFDRHDGISRFTAGIVGELAKLHPVTMLINDHRQLALLPDLPWQLISSPTSITEPFVARRVNRLKPDIVFSPMQTMGSWGRRYRLLLTVHDLIYYENRTPPRDLPAFVRGLWRLYHLAWWPQRLLLNRADGIVTVSQTTAALIEKHHLTERPVTVVANAADEFTGEMGERTRPESGVLVYMGSFMPYKGVETLVRGMALLPDHELHLVSRVSADERARLQALAPTARLVFHNGATDAEYADLLGRATALVHGSQAEGFGIPLVEAMRLGTPIVASDIPIFREIGGDAAVFFPVGDAAGFARAVTELDDDTVWSERSELAREASARYSWEASARTLMSLLETTVDAR